MAWTQPQLVARDAGCLESEGMFVRPINQNQAVASSSVIPVITRLTSMLHVNLLYLLVHCRWMGENICWHPRHDPFSSSLHILSV